MMQSLGSVYGSIPTSFILLHQTLSNLQLNIKFTVSILIIQIRLIIKRIKIRCIMWRLLLVIIRIILRWTESLHLLLLLLLIQINIGKGVSCQKSFRLIMRRRMKVIFSKEFSCGLFLILNIHPIFWIIHRRIWSWMWWCHQIDIRWKTAIIRLNIIVNFLIIKLRCWIVTNAGRTILDLRHYSLHFFIFKFILNF